MASTMVDKPPKINGLDKWEVEEAARTLTRAFEIKQNPKLMAAAMKIVNKQAKAAQAVKGWASNMKG